MKKTFKVICLLLSFCFLLSGCVSYEKANMLIQELETREIIKNDWIKIDEGVISSAPIPGNNGYFFVYETNDNNYEIRLLNEHKINKKVKYYPITIYEGIEIEKNILNYFNDCGQYENKLEYFYEYSSSTNSKYRMYYVNSMFKNFFVLTDDENNIVDDLSYIKKCIFNYLLEKRDD